jgi:hypothetical protein
MNGEAASLLPKDRSANGTSASVCLAGRIMRSNIRDLSGWMRSEPVEELKWGEFDDAVGARPHQGL